jgi:hypothetical protein
MVVIDVQNLAGCDSSDRAFIAFEKRGQGANGIYFNEFDKVNGTANQNPDTIFTGARKIIDGAIYQNRNIRNIWLYSNEDGSDITMTFLTEPIANVMLMFTGRIVNGQYISCDGGAATQINARFLNQFFGFYYNDGTKNKLFAYQDINGQFVAGAEAH